MAEAPGKPGISPRWTSSDKTGVGAALRAASRVWFTISHGILNECYYPRVDQACTRDFGFIVTDGVGFFAEEKRDTDSVITALEPGVPAYKVVNTHRPDDGGAPRFRLTKHIISDPRRDVVLQCVQLETLHGAPLRLFALMSPHLVNGGSHNTAWLGDYKSREMMFAEGDGTALALATNKGWLARSVGYVGESDGWRDLSQHFALTWRYDRAADGNVALCGEIDVAGGAPVVVAMGFGSNAAEAGFRARHSLQDQFDELANEYAQGWRDWQAHLRPLDRINAGQNTYRVSTAVLRVHEAPSFRGGYIASLSIPWGFSKGDDDLGGYHLVWPRDLAETAGGLLAAGARREAVAVLEYLRATQEKDGHWPQNSWLDGTAYWQGVQMDESAFPILLLDLAWREGALSDTARQAYWPMVRDAAGYLVRNGAATGQDRWEENGGYSTFTLAVEIAALLVAAEQAVLAGYPAIAKFLTDTADAWNDWVDDWTYARDTDLARELGIEGYYVRMAPLAAPFAESILDGDIQIKNRPDNKATMKAHEIISADALALVRFGLRGARDPRILNSVVAIDHLTRVELQAGSYWYRYNADGYGEHKDGRPFDGAGHGRLWPLLTGERAHYAIAAGDYNQARKLLLAMEAGSSLGALLPEQIWDQDDIPARELFRGKPSGSAMPLVWAHAEHIKLLRSLEAEAVFDMPPQTVQRYQVDKVKSRVQPWRPDMQVRRLPKGRALRIELSESSVVRWTKDGWSTKQDFETVDSGLGVHAVEIPYPAGSAEGLIFTFYNLQSGQWAGQNFAVGIQR